MLAFLRHTFLGYHRAHQLVLFAIGALFELLVPRLPDIVWQLGEVGGILLVLLHPPECGLFDVDVLHTELNHSVHHRGLEESVGEGEGGRREREWEKWRSGEEEREWERRKEGESKKSGEEEREGRAWDRSKNVCACVCVCMCVCVYVCVCACVYV